MGGEITGVCCQNQKYGLLCVKIDTNGSKPRVLHALFERGLVDYVALDFKAPIKKLQALCGRDYFKEFEESFALLKASKLSYEVRTTFHSELLSSQEIEEMRDWLRERDMRGNTLCKALWEIRGV